MHGGLLRRVGSVAGAMVALLAAGPALAAGKASVPATPEIAKRIVDAVRVGADDNVLIRTNPDALGLAEVVAAEAQKRGAAVTVQYLSPQVLRAFYAEGNDGLLERASPWDGVLGGNANVIIQLGANDDPAVEAGLDPGRIARIRRGVLADLERYYASDVRRLVVGNAAFPTDQAARFYKADGASLSKNFWEAVAVPLATTQDRTERLKKLLAGNRIVRVSAEGGTELELRLASRPLLANNGVITEDAAAQRGVKEAMLPAGEVMSVPTEFFANGRLFVDAVECGGVVVHGLKLVFKDGKASLDGGGEGYETFKKSFELAGGDKAVIGVLGVGTNAASRPTGLFRSSEMSGVVTLAIGYNRFWGGTNNTPFRAVFRLPNATLKVDDTVVVDKGVLKLK